MMVSCLMPTYGRCPDFQHLLEEAIESFLRQRLPAGVTAELVILNDCPSQTLVCDAPGVRIVNQPFRLNSLGEKYNRLVELARYDTILPAEDDDVFLRHRIAQAVEKLKGGAGYFDPGSHWLLAERPAGPEGIGLFPQSNRGVNHNASAYTRAAWEAAGRYMPISGAQDAVMASRLYSTAIVAPKLDPTRPDLFQYVYRWGVSPSHLSQYANPEAAYQAEAAKPHAAGTFTLRPHWRQDYEALCRSAISRSALA